MCAWFENYPGLDFERRDNGVLWVTINRPKQLNAANAELHLGLSRVWRDIDDDPDVRVAVITGAGQAFSAGGDLGWLESFAGDAKALETVMSEARDLVKNMLACSKLIVSAINGVAVGAGLAVALMADISLMAEEAKITDGHLRLGVAAGDHSAICWPLLCGLAKAKYYLLTADFIDGKTADRIGLVSKAVPAATLVHEADALAKRLALGSQPALRMTKRAINLWMTQNQPIFEASLAFEMLNFIGDDASEGVEALREQREPRFG